MLDAPRRYHPIHVTLHWLIAIGVFLNLYLGMIAFENHPSSPQEFQMQNTLVLIHMATGVLVLLLLLIRFFVRTAVPRPEDATSGNPFFDKLAIAVHYGLYIAVLAVTVFGLVFSLQTGRFQSAFLGAQSQPAPSEGGFSFLGLHEAAAYLVLALVVVHIAASLYHQFFRRDHLLARMWYGTR